VEVLWNFPIGNATEYKGNVLVGFSNAGRYVYFCQEVTVPHLHPLNDETNLTSHDTIGSDVVVGKVDIQNNEKIIWSVVVFGDFTEKCSSLLVDEQANALLIGGSFTSSSISFSNSDSVFHNWGSGEDGMCQFLITSFMSFILIIQIKNETIIFLLLLLICICCSVCCQH
jgi:hypothetical protein